MECNKSIFKLWIILFVLFFTHTLFAWCEKCNNKGYVKTNIKCYLCKGETRISPAWWDQSVGETTWQSLTYYGVEVASSDYKYKKFTWHYCPLCHKNKKSETFTTIIECKCGKDLTKENIKNYKDLKKLAKKYDIEIDNSRIDNDFFWTKIMFEKRNNWEFNSKNAKRLLKQALNEDYDLKSANYGRYKKSGRID